MSNALKIAGALGGAAAGNQTLYQIISGLGLTTNLKLCLDAGDSASYNASVQTDKWLDTSGGGYDFYRGSSASADAASPTFNGSAGGLSSSEYWSFDGGDYFLYDAANETWMENLHKDNAIFSVFMMVYIAAVAGGSNTNLVSTTSGTTTGFEIRVAGGTSGTPRLRILNGAAVPLSVDATNLLSWSAWHGLGVSLNEATGANGLTFMVDSASESFTSTYTSPAATAANHALSIASRVTTTNALINGSRMGCFAMWEGTRLTATNLTDIFNGIKGRFGL